MPIPNDSTLTALSRDVGARLLAARRRLVTAESCTGGWIAKLCTDIPGSSEWFDSGFVCYSNAAKTRDLGVPQKLIRDKKVVDQIREDRNEAGKAKAAAQAAGGMAGNAAAQTGGDPKSAAAGAEGMALAMAA